ncbi:MAG TPA: DNA polymerase III subunit chi [Alphaproteobacteria bacterium]|nr:DNA polymerase III subunit chi [Alphaproteobacteria bacterium]MDP6270324.1 DNA polymerase III subunit chi [Alphaproteobacteria bacterium]MDP7426885.1 DNA polymerase III subunit chi [Alphaproteobacteria bacterium]HJM51691.1 DNA polymerase III subunit chi [Alphaproteobacteria bacterium]
MTEVSFYHLERTALEQALPRLLEKVLERDWRALVVAASMERVEALNAVLWTYEQRSFLPHGSTADGRPEAQPVYLSPSQENLNEANVLVLVDGCSGSDIEAYDRVLDIFDGASQAAVEAARERWRQLSEAGHELTYWQQNPRGGWEKKA